MHIPVHPKNGIRDTILNNFSMYVCILIKPGTQNYEPFDFLTHIICVNNVDEIHSYIYVFVVVGKIEFKLFSLFVLACMTQYHCF